MRKTSFTTYFLCKQSPGKPRSEHDLFFIASPVRVCGVEQQEPAQDVEKVRGVRGPDKAALQLPVHVLRRVEVDSSRAARHPLRVPLVLLVEDLELNAQPLVRRVAIQRLQDAEQIET